jgi:predicted transcriptional regulator
MTYRETSSTAFASIQHDRANKAAQILEQIRAHGPHGATVDEIMAEHGWGHSTCSARFTELGQHGRITWDGVTKRKTRSGRPANVWVAV